MTVQEFSNQFDVLYNNIASNIAPGLNGYEKSVFLTKAQDEILKNYFNNFNNLTYRGYDANTKRQIDFSNLLKVEQQTVVNDATIKKLDNRSILYQFPTDALFIINEQLIFSNNTERTVVPLSFAEYLRLMSKPYKEPLKYQVWRLMNKTESNTRLCELILSTEDKKQKDEATYWVRYIRKPNPIILEDFTTAYPGENISINNQSTPATCELDPILHEEILQRAVELAKVAWANTADATISAGQRSE